MNFKNGYKSWTPTNLSSIVIWMIVSLIFQFDPIFRCAWCAQCTVYIVPFCKVWKRMKCYFEQKERKKERPKLNCVIKHRHNRSVCIKNDRIISTILKYQFQWWFSKKKLWTKLMISSMSRDSHISSDLLPFHRFTHSISLNTSVWRQIELVSHRKFRAICHFYKRISVGDLGT